MCAARNKQCEPGSAASLQALAAIDPAQGWPIDGPGKTLLISLASGDL
jgi:hypothetical protein